MNSLLRRSNLPSRSAWPEFTPWNRFFGDQFLDLWDGDILDTIPSMNIRDEKDQYELELAAPGMTKEDFNVDLEGNLLTISAEKEERTKEKEGKYSRREYNYSSFSRSFTLPDSADAAHIDAKYTDGILRLNIPKKAEATKKESSQHIAVK